MVIQSRKALETLTILKIDKTDVLCCLMLDGEKSGEIFDRFGGEMRTFFADFAIEISCLLGACVGNN